MRILELEGTPARMGEAFGEATRPEIAELYARRIENAIEQSRTLGGRAVTEAMILDVGRCCLPYVEAYHPAGHAELEGIARGAGLPIVKLWVMNALTDLRDVMAFGDLEAILPAAEACSSFVLQEDMTGPGQALCGQTWDLATDNMPFVLLVRRRPAGAPATLALTLVGCLSLIGMNDAGLAIGTTNVRTSDSRPGVGYLDIIHKALALTDLGDAAAAITGAHRAGAHYYYLLDARGRALAIECTATDAAALPIDRGAYVHCNHMRVARHRAVEKDTPGSTREREARLTALIAAASRPIGVETLKTFLADHDQSPRCICRHDFGGSSSNGSMIMCPTRGRAWAVHGQACAGDWIELSV